MYLLKDKIRKMKKLVKVSFFVGIACLSHSVQAQQDPQFTQYFDNALFVNPAYAGSTGMLTATSIHREQWVGFDGRPSSTTISLHSPLSYESVGLGLTAVRDAIGPMNQTMFYGDFSYSLKLTNKAKLAFGLKAGLNVISAKTNELQTTQSGDPSLLQNIQNKINPNFGSGLYYHTPKFFMGVATPKIIEQSIDGTETNKERRHYFVIAGGIIKANEDWKIRPTGQLKLTASAPMSIDLSVTGIYKDQIFFGSMYRLNAAFGAFAQYQLNKQFRVGLASDFSTTAVRNYNYGTYEVLISYDFAYNRKGIRSPRYF
jgi:type IX secretion system PorP/SprF family membrane protein